MIAEIISVGTELLLGNIVNTNAAFLAEECATLGLTVYHQSVVGDNEARMTEAIETAISRSDILILSGGLGPTQDDITKTVAAKVVGRGMVTDDNVRQHIQGYFDRLHLGMSNQEITENNWRQAQVPEDAIVLHNENGTAPGLILEEDRTCIILLPGPPGELIPLFHEHVFPYLLKKQPERIYSKMVKLCGIGESAAETVIQDLMESQTNPTIAPYAKTGEVHLRITAKVTSKAQAKELMRPVLQELKARFGKQIFTTKESVTLEDSIVALLKKKHLTITTTESCTGGAVASRLINASGVSEVYKEGFVTYSNQAKTKYLNVKKSTLKYGAVSEQTAREMAKGACKATKADLAIATTGIAGPDGGTQEKPVGLVYIACCVKGKVYVEKHNFNGNRSRVREQAVVAALTLLRDCVV